MSTPERKPLPGLKRPSLPATEDFEAIKGQLRQYWATLPAEDVPVLRRMAIHESAWASVATVAYGFAASRITMRTSAGWRFSCTAVASAVGAVSGAMLGFVTLGEQRWEEFGRTGAGRILAPYWSRYGGRRAKTAHKE